MVSRPDLSLTPGESGPEPVARDVPSSLKRQVFAEYGIGSFRRVLFTIDHLVPLELNGTNSIRNLWPQPRLQARLKDRDENRLARSVAAGSLSLVQAQQQILMLWGSSAGR